MWAVVYDNHVNIHDVLEDAEQEVEICRQAMSKIKGQEKPIWQPRLMEATRVTELKSVRPLRKTSPAS